MGEELPSLPNLHLVRGVRNPAVAEVRDRLERLGLLGVIPPEGDKLLFCSNVDVAVRSFQQDRGIMIDGVVGPATFRQLEEARWNLGDRIVSYSVTHMTAGDDVANLQQQLNSLGFDAGRVDGVFGPDTDRALREFQRNFGLEVDGTCGPEVWRALDRLSRTVKGGAAGALRSEHHHAMSRTGVADKVVVIDPGHGGPDYGDVAHRLAESILADDLCRRIEGRLAAIGTQVLVTRPRTHDVVEPIDEATRASFANETGADLVVSLHTDFEPTGVARGIATYYFGNLHDESMMGRSFAESVQQEIVRRTDLVDCRSHGKTWDLLRLTRMPTVRIEFGYLSNASDAQRLSDADFRDVVAEAVAVAIIRFFAPEESSIAADAPSPSG